jgi:hypothetical protein
MAITCNKSELQEAINISYNKLIAELATIPFEATNKKELEGHAKNTLMSINNILAYLIGWGQLVLKWNDLHGKGLKIDFPETNFKWNELGLLAQKFYIDNENDDFYTLKAKIDQTTAEILKLVEHKTNYELYETPWYEKWPLGKMIQWNTSSPFKNATIRIRKWKKSDSAKTKP